MMRRPEPTQRTRTTPEHFALFQSECKACAERWGVNDLGLYFHHGERDDVRAQFVGRHQARIATLVLSTVWEEADEKDPAPPVTDEEIKTLARHEMIHAMLLPMAAMIGNFCSEDEAKEAEERIVQRLIRLLP